MEPFSDFYKDSFNNENEDFLYEYDYLLKIRDKDEINKKIIYIYENFIENGCKKQLNIGFEDKIKITNEINKFKSNEIECLETIILKDVYFEIFKSQQDNLYIWRIADKDSKKNKEKKNKVYCCDCIIF